MKKEILQILLIFIAGFILACGEDTTNDSSSTGSDSSTGGGSSGNLVRIIEFFGTDGNLYKPFGDPTASGAGNMVVLLSSKYIQRFDTCEIPTVDGGIAQLTCLDTVPWTHIPYSCFSNGNRQTWRSNFSCHNVAEIEVTCRDATREVIFTVPDQLKQSVCQRFG